MITPEQVPDAVIDAAIAMRERGGSMSDIIRTAINTWPRAEYGSDDGGETYSVVLLPLTGEP